jgi:alpha,alpha-trehalase
MDSISPNNVDDFIQLSGPLFEAVQRSGIFPDSKTFVDCIPKSNPQDIRQKYEKQKKEAGFNLKRFVETHFQLPHLQKKSSVKSAESMYQHIDQLWEQLSRQADAEISPNSTLIPLPYSYIVPGGRFREIYYWDTYFTALGLARSQRLDMVEQLARNFSWLIEKTGHIPNGNRYYYLSRSQPPFFILLVDLIAQYKGKKAIENYLPALEKEYAFWMDGADTTSPGKTHRRVVNIDGNILNRYWDDRPLPREESWREDVTLANGLSETEASHLYRDLRAGAESGWDFSSRWLRDGQSLESIQTSHILPVDLNALLYYMETKLSEWHPKDKNRYSKAAQKRKEAFNRYFWDQDNGYYFDYNWKNNQRTNIWSLAGMYPLFVGLAANQQATSTADIAAEKFLKEGGLVTTLHETGQQWDAPNGWAPLQWIAVRGLLNYGKEQLASEIAKRWLNLNKSVYQRTGKMMEKYNVCDLSLKAGGGEYPLQDGFGWTNGVAIAFRDLLKNKL